MGNECQPAANTDYCVPSLVPESSPCCFLSSISIQGNPPSSCLPCERIYLCHCGHLTSISLGQRRATAQWKLAFATCVNNPSEYPGFDLPSECSEATINSKVPHQVKMSLGVSSPRKLWSSPCLNWKRLSICVRHYTVSYLVFFTVLLNGKYKWLIPLLVISATQMVSSCSRLPPECVLLGCLVQYVYMRLCLHPYSMSFCIGSVIEKNPQFCDFFN